VVTIDFHNSIRYDMAIQIICSRKIYVSAPQEVTGLSVTKKEFRTYWIVYECIIIEVYKMLMQTRDSVKIQFDRIRTKGW
jgi:hypothetical protein